MAGRYIGYVFDSHEGGSMLGAFRQCLGDFLDLIGHGLWVNPSSRGSQFSSRRISRVDDEQLDLH